MNTFSRGGGSARGRLRQQQPPDAHRINSRIIAREVRVIGADGEQLGILGIRQALEAAEQAGLDLVEVAPQASPPVCRIMDYGKFKYREQKKEAEARKKRTETHVKELRLRYRTEKGDLETKLKHAREFLAEGDKVKFTMRFQGREVMFANLGMQKIDAIIEQLADISTVDERSPLTGRQFYVILAPLKLTAQHGAGRPKTEPKTQESKETGTSATSKSTVAGSVTSSTTPSHSASDK